MSENSNFEIYRQRYETFRHLDRIRWQMLQISVAVGTISSAVLGNSRSEPNWWIVLVTGLILLTLGIVMIRIQGGIEKNGKVLLKVGKEIGDVDIPKPSKFWKSRANWVAFTIILVGLFCLVASGASML